MVTASHYIRLKIRQTKPLGNRTLGLSKSQITDLQSLYQPISEPTNSIFYQNFWESQEMVHLGPF